MLMLFLVQAQVNRKKIFDFQSVFAKTSAIVIKVAFEKISQQHPFVLIRKKQEIICFRAKKKAAKTFPLLSCSLL